MLIIIFFSNYVGSLIFMLHLTSLAHFDPLSSFESSVE